MIVRGSFSPRPVSEVRSEALQRPDWTAQGKRDPSLLWLDKNENMDPKLQSLTARVLSEIDPNCVSVYPDTAPLYHKLAQYLGVSPKSLVLAQGSDGVIGAVFRAFVAPGDTVLITDPTYAMYQVYARMQGAVTVKLQYAATDSGPLLTLEKMLREIANHRPKLVCLPNPDSPTGTVFDPNELRLIAASALECNAALLIDEAYYPFHDETTLQWIDDFPNLIVARTFSKAWGLTGLRLGYGVATEEVTELLQKVRPNYEVSQVAVAVATRMISDFESEMRASVARLNEGRDRFLKAMAKLGLRTLASNGNFCHVSFGSGAERVHDALRDLVLYRAESDIPCLKGYSRFSSTTSERFAPVVQRIKDALETRTLTRQP